MTVPATSEPGREGQIGLELVLAAALQHLRERDAGGLDLHHDPLARRHQVARLRLGDVVFELHGAGAVEGSDLDRAHRLTGWRFVRFPVLTPEPGELPRRWMTTATRGVILLAIISANVVGALIVMALLAVVLPVPDEVEGLGVSGLIAGGGYALAAILIGTVRGLRLARPVIAPFKEDRRPNEDERAAILALPVRLSRLQLVLWAGAVIVFSVDGATTSALYAFENGITIALTGVAVAALSYLQVGRLLRGAIDAALSEAPPRRREVAGVGVRVLLTWALCTAVPVAGALMVAIFALVIDADRDALARSTIVLCGVSLWVGLVAMIYLARSLSDPLRRLRDALADVEGGNYDTRVHVFDATEVGFAAAGFNRMVSGLQEREKLRDLFGRQVGEDVARRALEEGVTLGGEEREAAVLFVDVIGSTSFAADRPPGEVVDALNAFFATVVEITQDCGGFVNKFEGDAALCVFGAPLAVEDAAGAALRAARRMCKALSGRELDAAIGVSFGTVVAGNVGAADRYEYTVIGDPVNEAARLTELAKESDGRLLASERALDAADEEERSRWTLGDEVTLRGRSEPTRLAEPTG